MGSSSENKDMDKFIELLKSGDYNKLVAFAKTLKKCPYCQHPIKWENNQIYCDGCKMFGLREPSVVPDNAGVW